MFNIFKRHKGCPYCLRWKAILDIKGMEVRIGYANLLLIQPRNKSDRKLKTIKIHYCPMCGRKLHELF